MKIIKNIGVMLLAIVVLLVTQIPQEIFEKRYFCDPCCYISTVAETVAAAQQL